MVVRVPDAIGSVIMASEERIQKLEEAQAFSERTVEELEEEVRALSRRVVELAAALARLEAKQTAEPGPSAGIDPGR